MLIRRNAIVERKGRVGLDVRPISSFLAQVGSG